MKKNKKKKQELKVNNDIDEFANDPDYEDSGAEESDEPDE